MMIALVLAIIALSVPCTTAGRSTNEENMLASFNGYFDNLDQYQADPTSFSYIQLRLKPVEISALPGRTVIYHEWASDGQVLDLNLIDVVEDTKGLVHLVFYNFTDPSQYKTGEYNVDDVAKLTPADLHRPACEAQFETYELGGFVGTWQGCRHYYNGKRIVYGVTINCDLLVVIVPREANEESPDMPYNLVLKGDKFPVPGLPDDYVSPCQLKK